MKGTLPLGVSDGVSREVPCSALKGETVPDSLPATPKSPPTRRVPPRGAAAFSSYDGDLSLPLGLALGSPIFPSGCEGKLAKATLWMKAQHEGALPPPCIVRKDPRFPQPGS